MILKGKKALILGVANERSIAWAIAQKFHQEGAEIGLTYLNDKLKSRVELLSQETQSQIFSELDVANDDHFEKLQKEIQKKWGKFDILVHSIAFANKEDLINKTSDTTKEGFLLAHEISVFSLLKSVKFLKNFMNSGGSIITLTYIGSQKVIPNYNVMGIAKAALESSVRYLAYELGEQNIRINALSPSPIKTLAASAIPGFSGLLNSLEEKSPIKDPVKAQDVANVAVFFGSNLSEKVTGQVLLIDSGLSIMGL